MIKMRPMRLQARLAEAYAWLRALDRAKLAAIYREHRRLSYGVAVAMLIAILASVVFVVSILRAVPDRDALRGIGTMAQATTLLDASNQHAFTIFREQRVEVPLSGVSKRLVDAILAIEDQRFYDHSGIDVVRVAGAALNNVMEGRLAQGGSTLTQQLRSEERRVGKEWRTRWT